MLVATSSIPQRYLSLAGSGFDEKGFEYYALELKGNISAYHSTLNRLRKELVKKVAL